MDDLRHVFRWHMDFPSDLRPGDTFRAVILRGESDAGASPAGISMGDHRIVGAEVSARGRTTRAVWYRSPGGAQRGYFELDGTAVGATRIPTPDGFRLTSRFSWGRFHPVLRERRPHLGLDYAVPYGETVRAVAAGQVTEVGRIPGFGLVVEIRHDAHRSTRYAHLSSINSGIVPGRTIAAGTEVGRAGATGVATAPHLHFEYLLDGQQRDPLAQASAEISRAPAADLPAFIQQRDRIVDLLETRAPANPTAGIVLVDARDRRRGPYTAAGMMLAWIQSSGPLPGTDGRSPARWPIPRGDDGRAEARVASPEAESAKPGDVVCAVARAGEVHSHDPPYFVTSGAGVDSRDAGIQRAPSATGEYGRARGSGR